jgi:16S rRNA (guanine527-N7)-methyltransferase
MSDDLPSATPTDAAGLVAKAQLLGVTLASEAAARLLAYLDAMLALNEQLNLTAVRDREAAVVLHALDSLAFGRLSVRPQHLLDLGSGNGFPGVAVALLHPNASAVLLDRTGKKVRAIGACLLTARIDGVETVQADAQQAPSLHREMRGAFDVVTARAVGAPEAVAQLAAPLLRPRGALVLWLDAATAAPAALPDCRREHVEDYALPEPAPRQRRLAVYRRR